MSCSNKKTIDIQGHRGCRGLMPENTIEAFTKAINLGVNTLELDVVVSKDSVVIVSHEPFISRVYCLNADGTEIPEDLDMQFNLYNMHFDSIKQFDCGLKHHERFPFQKKIKAHKPALDAVFKAAKQLNPEIKFNIELKAKPKYDDVFTPKPKEFVNLVLKVINTNEAFNYTNLQSFDTRILEEIKKQAPKMPVALLVDENESINEKRTLLSFKPEIISPYFELLNNKVVDSLQTENFKVIPWTINETEDLKHMIALGVDGIITDYPDRLTALLK